MRSLKGNAAQILSALEQQIKRIEDEVVGFFRRERRLQCAEIRQLTVIQRDDFAVDDAIAQRRAASFAMALKRSVQSSPLRVRMTARPSSTRSCAR